MIIIMMITIIKIRCRAAKCCQRTSSTTTLGALGWYKTAQQQGNGWRTSSELLGLYSINQFYLRLREPGVASRLHKQQTSSLAEPLSRPLCVVKSQIRLEVILFYAEQRCPNLLKRPAISLGSSSSGGAHQQTDATVLRTSWSRR